MASWRQARRAIPAALQGFFGCSECGRGAAYMEDPVVLPCLHSICLDCLERRVRMSLCKDEVECPACTQRAPIPPGGLKAFPEDRFSRVAMKTLTEPGFTFLPGGPNPKCGLHPKEEISHYCHGCHVQICRKCVTSYHNDHEAKMEGLGTVAARMDQELTAALDRTLEEVTTAILRVDENRTAMQSDVDQVSQQVNDRAQQLIQEVEKWRDHNLKELEYIKQQQYEPLQQAAEKLETQQAALQEYKQYVDILHERGKDLDKTAHVPGLQELVQKLVKAPCSETLTWRAEMVRLERPVQRVDLVELFGKIRTCTNLFQGLQQKETIPVSCDGAYCVRHVTLFGNQQVLHSFSHGNNKNMICVHNTDGSVKKQLAIPKMVDGCSSAVVDRAGGSLVVADSCPWGALGTKIHMDSCLHWLTVSPAYDIIKHERTDLGCLPNGHINVDSSGQVLVTTRCGTKEHPSRIVIFDQNTHRRLQTVHLPDMLKDPFSAVSSASGVLFTVVFDHRKNQVVWLDHSGTVLRRYGDRPEQKLGEAQHVVQHSEGYLLISDLGKHRVDLVSRDGVFLQHLLTLDQSTIPGSIHLDEGAGLLAVGCYYPKQVMVFEFRPHTHKHQP